MVLAVTTLVLTVSLVGLSALQLLTTAVMLGLTVLATVRADGRPHTAPIWFDLDGDTLVFTTGENTVKGQNMRRDPRVSLCIEEEEPPFHFVVIEGKA